jgi:eukaryotic-like serine/threonine-protein kinase
MPKLYQPGQRIDHYTIVRQFNTGTTSYVYLAKDTQTDRQVVLKFAIDDMIGDADSYRSYLLEKELGTILDHPNIPHHLNQDEQRQTDYLVMEYIEGRVLRSVIHEDGTDSLSVAQILQFIISVCEALAYAHAHGVIHRDIKPENIIVTNTGTIKIIDFGIALLLTKQNKLRRLFPARLIGTPNYMAPELFWGKHGSPRSDIYAVGIILYELLCGRIPFERKGEFTYMNPQMAYDPPSILSIKPELSPALATVVMRMIRRDPQKRYAQMPELLQDLKHLDEVLPVEYDPDPPKIGGRYRQFIALALIILVIFGLMIAFGFLAQSVHSVAH